MAASAGFACMEPWRRIDRASEADARALFASCCGSSRWVDAMAARRPFGTLDALLKSAREVWASLSPPDWTEAFGHHPRIGDRRALAEKFAATRHLSAEEQA